VTTTISGNNYTASTTYDQFGCVFQAFDGAETYSGLQYYYNAFGHLEAPIESRRPDRGTRMGILHGFIVYRDVRRHT
jgi:hypothetical protein